MHRVLVVDDESDVTELLQYRLEQEGYRVATLNDPLGFAVKVREFEPDLMLLDIMMPELSGIQLCRIVRADPLMKDIPVIFLSARGEVEDRIKGLEAGAEDYLSKPFNTNELLLRISKMLSRSGAHLEHAGQSRIEIAGVVIEEDLHQLTVDGKNVFLIGDRISLTQTY